MAEEKIIYSMPKVEMPDEEIVDIAAGWQEESEKYHSELEKFWKINEAYYLGDQTEKSRIPSDMSDMVQNNIFMGVETLVPIITSNSPQFVVEPPEDSEVSIKYAESLEKVEGILYETKDIRSKGEIAVRHMLLNRYGVLIPFWNKETNEPDLRYARPHRVYFPKVDGELPYIYERQDFSAEQFIEEFGEDKYKEFMKKKGIDVTTEEVTQEMIGKYNDEKRKGMYSILEFWTKDMRFWKTGGHIIEKEANPYYDFENKTNNHFLAPKIPYIVMSAFKVGDSVVGITDLITQTIPLQDIINVVSRLVVNNANKTGNAAWFVDSDVMTEEEAKNKITNSCGLIFYGAGAANEGLVRRESPPPLPQYILELKMMAEQAFDNVFGTHSTTRGERQKPETLGGRLLLKQADLGRIDLIVREWERVISEIGNWFAQLLKLFLDEEREFRMYGETGVAFVKLNKKMIENGVRVIIKSGTTLPTDEISKRNEALQLFSLGGLDPITLFERLKFPNPEAAAERLVNWRTGRLFPAQAGQPVEEQGRGVKPIPSPMGGVGAAEGMAAAPPEEMMKFGGE